jgi:threonine dehydrogenase-like Zn-dependent dehydrogenase
MRAFVVTGPRRFEVQYVAPPTAAPGQVVVDVERVGLCGTDVELSPERWRTSRRGTPRTSDRGEHDSHLLAPIVPRR